jgi:nitrogen fixation protein FixH
MVGACSGQSSNALLMSTPSDQVISLEFKVDPNPPRSGDNQVEVQVRNADGSAVTDASVSATFYMPAMPSMNMPEMRDVFTLSHTRGGHYAGKGSLEMAGTWDVTVKVSRGGETVAKGRSTVIAK